MASPMPLDAGRLRLLHEVGVRGSISAAARSLGITASAVSQQLAALEREAGAALVDRTSRGVVLTAAGGALAERAAQVADILSAARADLDRLAGATTGPLRVAAVASAAATIVSAAVRDLASRAPGIEVSVVAAEPGRGIGLLLAGDADLAVVDEYDHVPLAVPDTAVVRELAVESLVLVQPVGDGVPSAGLRELADRDWVMPPADAACGQAVRAACRTAGFEPRVRWETDDMLLLYTAVRDGHGVTALPPRALPPNPGGVRVAPLREPTVRRRLLAVGRPGAAERPVVTALLDALTRAVEAAAPGPLALESDASGQLLGSSTPGSRWPG